MATVIAEKIILFKAPQDLRAWIIKLFHTVLHGGQPRHTVLNQTVSFSASLIWRFLASTCSGVNGEKQF